MSIQCQIRVIITELWKLVLIYKIKFVLLQFHNLYCWSVLVGLGGSSGFRFCICFLMTFKYAFKYRQMRRQQW